MIYMICYDITDPKRLRKTAKILEDFGIRVQYSFFQCEMRKEKLEELKRNILDVIDLETDNFFIYPLCEDCSRKAIVYGNKDVIKLQSFEII